MTNPATLLRGLKDALDRHDRIAVNRACRALIDARAPLGGQWRSIAAVLVENGEMRDARRAIDLLAQATNHSPLGRFAQAETYARSGRAAEASALMEAVPNDIPDPLGNAYIRGTLATNLGKFDVAREHLRRAVRLQPRSGQSWLALTTVGAVDHADHAALTAVRDAMAGAPLVERGAYFYALGKALHERQDYDDAFAAFAEGARAEAAARPDDAAAEEVGFNAAIQGWSRETIATLSRPTRALQRPIFVTGMPRSGTTLVEQILASHSGVDGGEELGLFRHIVGEIGGTDLASVSRAASAGRLDAMVALYGHLLAERFPGTGRVVDKSLRASRHMGLIAAMFPDAPIIWLRRDPLDNAWSIFRTYFRQEQGWTFDLDAIAREMRRDDILFDYWRALRPDRILPIFYADLVRNPSEVIPQIAAHCGLALEPQQMRPHESNRAVTTASVAQVRAPIGTGAIGAAEPYRRHLQPFIDAYTAAGGTIA